MNVWLSEVLLEIFCTYKEINICKIEPFLLKINTFYFYFKFNNQFTGSCTLQLMRTCVQLKLPFCYRDNLQPSNCHSPLIPFTFTRIKLLCGIPSVLPGVIFNSRCRYPSIIPFIVRNRDSSNSGMM